MDSPRVDWSGGRVRVPELREQKIASRRIEAAEILYYGRVGAAVRKTGGTGGGRGGHRADDQDGLGHRNMAQHAGDFTILQQGLGGVDLLYC